MIKNEKKPAENEYKSSNSLELTNGPRENKNPDLSIKTSDSSNKTSTTTESLNIIPSSSDVNATGCFEESPGDMEANPNKRGNNCSAKQLIVMSLTTFAVFLGIAAATGITLTLFTKKSHIHGKIHDTYAAELYAKAAVSSDAGACSKIGVNILRQNGSAVDSAIATTLCLGVINMYATGIGGGGFMLIYIKENNTFEALDFRERAPGKSTVDMFEKNINKSRYGGQAIGVPGQIKGLYFAWRKYGRLPWEKLVDTAIQLTSEGFVVHPILNRVATLSKEFIKTDAGLRNLLLTSGYQPIQAGTVLKDPKLAETLKIIRDDPESFYSGKLAEKIVKDISIAGGIVTLDDLAEYKVETRNIITTYINDLKLSTIGLPSGGVSVIQFLNILKGYFLSPLDMDPTDPEKSAKTYHRIIEALKFTFAQKSKYGDPNFIDKNQLNKETEHALDENFGDSLRLKIDDSKTRDFQYYGSEYVIPSDKGTSHASILAENGDAVSVTTTINEWFGCMYRSTETGIIYNNEMSDFSTMNTIQEGLAPLAPSPYNKVHSGKTPVSSMSPIIMTDKNGEVKFVIGGTGGGRIIASVSQAIINKMWFGLDLAHSVASPRLYHQLWPNYINIEEGSSISEEIIKKLQAKGHTFETILPMKTSAQAIYVERPGIVYAMSDPRREGKTDGY
ncbi:glutathione hydrolase 1 proenzyme [Hydra vulgaris]|uniref:Glutathione hydrolase 1 proenzyme n=1 Tax=Hydra vulgaris TaxID=6087 RepID=A0ABM4CN72_HYDVU